MANSFFLHDIIDHVSQEMGIGLQEAYLEVPLETPLRVEQKQGKVEGEVERHCHCSSEFTQFHWKHWTCCSLSERSHGGQGLCYPHIGQTLRRGCSQEGMPPWVGELPWLRAIPGKDSDVNCQQVSGGVMLLFWNGDCRQHPELNL